MPTEQVIIDVVERGTIDTVEKFQQLAQGADKASVTVDRLTGSLSGTISTTDKVTGVTKSLAVEQGKVTKMTETLTTDNTKLAGSQEKVIDATKRQSKETNELTSFVKGLAGAFTAMQVGKAVADIVKLADSYTAAAAKLREYTKSSAEFNAVSSQLTAASSKTGISIGELTSAYGQLKTSSTNAYRNTSDLTATLTTAGMAIRSTSASSADAASGLQEFAKQLATGRITGEQYAEMMAKQPGLANALAKGTGIGAESLKVLGLSAGMATAALARQSTAIAKTTADSQTLATSFDYLRNKFGEFVSQADNAGGVTSVLSTAVRGLANNIPALVTGLGLAVAAWLAYKTVVIAVAIAQGALNLVMLANPITLFVTAIMLGVAAFVAFKASTAAGREELVAWGKSLIEGVKWIADFVEGGLKLFGGFWEGLSTGFSSSLEFVSSTFSSMYEIVSGWVSSVVGFFTDTIPNTVAAGLALVKNTFISVWTSIKDFVLGIINSIVSYVTDLVNRVTAGIRSMVSAAKSVGSSSGESSSKMPESVTKVDGFRASGGPVKRGKTYVVGEDGPETFVPGASGSIVPNGGGKATSSAMGSRSTAIESLTTAVTDGTKAGFASVVEGLDKLTKLVQGGSGGSGSVGTSGGSGAALNPTGGFTALNNFGQPAVTQPASNSNVPQAVSPPTMGGGGGGSSGASGDITSLDNGTITTFARKYAELIAKNDHWSVTDNQRRVNYLNAERYLANVPGGIRDMVKSLAGTFLPTKMTGGETIGNFRSGGAFKVGGSTGADSKRVTMGVTPGEQVHIKTRKQVRDEAEANSNGGNVYNLTMTINTPDADSFRKSEKQIYREELGKMIRAAR